MDTFPGGVRTMLGFSSTPFIGKITMTAALVVGLLGVAAVDTAAAPAPMCRGHEATLVGTDGADTLTGTAGRDVIVAGPGDDVVRGLAGNDLICGGAGHDEIFGGAGRDVIDAGPGHDHVRSGPDNDKATGGSGDDTLGGGAGDDRLRGGSGDDTARGHRGTDACWAERQFGCEQDDEVVVEHDIAYGEADGQVLLLDLYRPGAIAQQRPAVIYAHGGSFTGGSRTSPQSVAYATDLAGAELVAASISYRLNGLNPGGIADAQHDMQAAVRWVRSNSQSLKVDPDRIYVMGYSAGAMTALFTNFNSEDPGQSGTPGVPSHVAGAVSLAGLVDPTLIDPGEPP
ncbi:MAG: alpha/beta hydrolase fold domain-containing protein, partial [Acidimicrobiia bacterium]|nr:alpha/beta hydrolase fold domain-containing protein [Acidimicrobiia bacterium]